MVSTDIEFEHTVTNCDSDDSKCFQCIYIILTSCRYIYIGIIAPTSYLLTHDLFYLSELEEYSVTSCISELIIIHTCKNHAHT